MSVVDEGLLATLRHSRELTGATPGTLEAFLAVRGVRTLAPRLTRAQDNAMPLAERLARHPAVTRARYPGLSSHPTHAAARRQLGGFGTIISFDIRGEAPAADAVCTQLQLIQHATSLGAVESTIERRASVPQVGLQVFCGLPKDFQFATDDVLIRKVGDDVILSPRPRDWKTYL